MVTFHYSSVMNKKDILIWILGRNPFAKTPTIFQSKWVLQKTHTLHYDHNIQNQVKVKFSLQ
jgi:hypothetical protein